MFKFNFNVEETTESMDIQSDIRINEDNISQQTKPPPLQVSSVEELIKALPPLISYSPLRIPLSDDQTLLLIRRDLFDARFQLISDSRTADISDDLAFIDAPSDLVSGLYEGGLKTWECSADLAGYLDSIKTTAQNPNRSYRRIFEVGCGTAVPTLYLLRQLFYTDLAHFASETSRTTLHLQDYNSVVLQLVTLPNILLTWYASSASEPYRAKQDPPIVEVDVSEPGEFSLTPELLLAFVESLRERQIDLTFISGSWIDTDAWIRKHQVVYDLVLTSETIYRPSSLPSLISLLRSASTPLAVEQKEETPSNEFASLSLCSSSQTSALCFVAAKVVYFGVGGGVDGFEKAIRRVGGAPKTVFERTSGVCRRVIQVIWDQFES